MKYICLYKTTDFEPHMKWWKMNEVIAPTFDTATVYG